MQTRNSGSNCQWNLSLNLVLALLLSLSYKTNCAMNAPHFHSSDSTALLVCLEVFCIFVIVQKCYL